MDNKKLFEELLKADGIDPAGATEAERVAFTKMLDEQSRSKHSKPGLAQPNIWRIIMKNKITKLAAAAVIIVSLTLSITLFDSSIPTASAAQILAQAIEAMPELFSVHIEAQMRTLPADNFMHIDPDRDFVPIKMWKNIDENGILKWRIQKPYRYAVMNDGRKTTMVIRDSYAVSGGCRDFGCFDLRWLGQLLKIDKLLEYELQNARQFSDKEYYIRRELVNGKDMTILEVESFTDVAEDDYLRNKFIQDSDNLRVYYFDAETKLLENLEIYVHLEDKDVMIFEITNIEFNTEIDPKLFELDLPENIVWDKPIEKLPDNKKYQQMSPKEVAITFFQACADEDWDEYLKFNSQSHVSEMIKNYLGGIEIISIGEPFKSGNYGGWFIPYEIKLKSGYIKKHNLAIRNDNRAKRWQVDGGI